MESEYIALADCVSEALWWKKIAEDIPCVDGTMTVLCDNQAAIKFSKHPVQSDRSKHIDIHYHFVREQVQLNALDIQYVATSEMIADMLTKPLTSNLLQRFCKLAGLQKGGVLEQ